MRSSSEKLSGSISVFAAVVDMRTFAAASEVIGMTPPGVSRAIARLEKAQHPALQPNDTLRLAH